MPTHVMNPNDPWTYWARMVDMARDFVEYRANDPKFQPAMHSMSPPQAASSFLTVQLDSGRQTGKTRYILNNAMPGDLVMVSTPHLLDMWLVQYPKLPGVTLISPAHLGKHGINLTANTIFVDDASYIDRASVDFLIRSTITPQLTQRYVLLG